MPGDISGGHHVVGWGELSWHLQGQECPWTRFSAQTLPPNQDEFALCQQPLQRNPGNELNCQ